MVVVEGGRILCFVVSLSGSLSTTWLLPDMAHTRRPLRSDCRGFKNKKSYKKKNSKKYIENSVGGTLCVLYVVFLHFRLWTLFLAKIYTNDRMDFFCAFWMKSEASLNLQNLLVPISRTKSIYQPILQIS